MQRDHALKLSMTSCRRAVSSGELIDLETLVSSAKSCIYSLRLMAGRY